MAVRLQAEAVGSFVSKWTIFKNSLVVAGGEDLMKQVYGWNRRPPVFSSTGL